jgi:putative transposase
MMLVMGFWTFLRAMFFGSAAITLENVALRHQLLVLQRSVGRPRLSRWDRVFWVWLSRLWVKWRSSLVIVRPATVLAWHRQGFRLYWRWKSRPNLVGRPKLTAEIRHLIRQMARRIRRGGDGASGPNSPCSATASPNSRSRGTCTGRRPGRRPRGAPFSPPMPEISWPSTSSSSRPSRFACSSSSSSSGVTAANSSTGTSRTVRPLVEAFPYSTAPKYLLRDRDGVYGKEFVRRVERLGIREVLIAPRAPWQNAQVSAIERRAWAAHRRMSRGATPGAGRRASFPAFRRALRNEAKRPADRYPPTRTMRGGLTGSGRSTRRPRTRST